MRLTEEVVVRSSPPPSRGGPQTEEEQGRVRSVGTQTDKPGGEERLAGIGGHQPLSTCKHCLGIGHTKKICIYTSKPWRGGRRK